METFEGEVVAVIQRLDEVEDKWVVAPQNVRLTKGQVEEFTHFQEKYFQIEIDVLP